MGFKSFEELQVWKEARNFRIQITMLSKSFPAQEKYALSSQIIRSARSITSNIAEGFGRFHHKENIQFCRMARGSLFETLDHLICARDEGYISEEKFTELKKQYDEILKLLNGYISYLKKLRNKDD
ncbi:MAG TPA: four helix bundle protein [Caldithrix abyssi]|uniref:Four helix bundle protein n=1 Tax=Caldithrix abyssi TaxID=187145 RepID=A0A7V4WUR3_CALAY|nr:four helix bundle protein [Caldithrix abyssi]